MTHSRSEKPDNTFFLDFPWPPPHEQGSTLAADGGAATPTSVNSPRTVNAGLPWRNRCGERVWFGRVERMPGAE